MTSCVPGSFHRHHLGSHPSQDGSHSVANRACTRAVATIGDARVSYAGPLLMLFVAVAVLSGGCDERREYSYPSLGAAAAAGEITRGWIPTWLPQSSRRIKLFYDPSSPTTWCAFQFSLEDSGSLRTSLARAASLPPEVRKIPDPNRTWWPDFLTGEIVAPAVTGRGFEIYVVTEYIEPNKSVALVAVNWTNGTGYFYRR